MIDLIKQHIYKINDRATILNLDKDFNPVDKDSKHRVYSCISIEQDFDKIVDDMYKNIILEKSGKGFWN